MTKAQSCAQLENSDQQVASYQRKEERLRSWAEVTRALETAGQAGTAQSWLQSCNATALPLQPVQCTALILGSALEKPLVLG